MSVSAAVVDASAVAALLFDEPRAADVEKELTQSSYLLAPTLLRYEVGSVCLKKLARYPQQREQLVATLRLLERMDIDEAEVPVEEVVPLAERHALSVYDASYLWLARTFGCRLVTLDAKLGAVARG